MTGPGLAQPGLAFAAGVLTVAAPCVLPVLPVVLGVATARGPGARPVFIAAGFASSFTLLALVFGSVQHLLGLEQQTVRDIGALLLVMFGLSMFWPRIFQTLTRVASGPLSRISSLGGRAGPGWIGALLVGVSLGAVWTPCAGPVLATILTLVAAQTNWTTSATLLGLYSLGAALPMLGIAYGGNWVLAKVHVLAGHAHKVQRAMGLIVAAVGILTFLQYDALVILWLSDFYPSISEGL